MFVILISVLMGLLDLSLTCDVVDSIQALFEAKDAVADGFHALVGDDPTEASTPTVIATHTSTAWGDVASRETSSQASGRASQATVTSATSSPSKLDSKSEWLPAQLEQLHAQKARGVLTDEEYVAAKKAVISAFEKHTPRL